MERRVKERLVGACLLVVLFILVVPELLSGPKPPSTVSSGVKLPANAAQEPTRTVNVDLNTNKAAVEGDPVAPAEPPPTVAGVPPAVATPPPVATPAHDTREPAIVAPPVTKPVLTKPPSPPPKSAAAPGNWAVQAGTFNSRSNADALVRKLRAQGFSAAVSEGTSGKKVYYRVRSSGLADRSAAERLAGRLKAAGHSVSVVALVH